MNQSLWIAKSGLDAQQTKLWERLKEGDDWNQPRRTEERKVTVNYDKFIKT